jgi:hypothetical protein
VQLEIVLGGVLGDRRRQGCLHRAVVLYDAFERFESEVEPVEPDMAPFELRQHAQRLRVVAETAMARHREIEGLFAGVAERRMA